MNAGAGKILKRVESLLRLPPEYPYEELRKVLEFLGFRERKAKGSHRVFVGPHPLPPHSKIRLVVPLKQGRWVKRVYLQQVIKTLDLEAWYGRQKSQKEGRKKKPG